MRVKNKRPWAVEIPDVGVVDAGATIDVPDDLGASLCEQEDNWAPVGGGPKAKSADADKED